MLLVACREQGNVAPSSNAAAKHPDYLMTSWLWTPVKLVVNCRGRDHCRRVVADILFSVACEKNDSHCVRMRSSLVTCV